jgi:hypothetical protein
VRGLAGPRWRSNNELFGILVIRHIGEGADACLKDAPTDFPVDPGGELTGLLAYAFDFGNSFSVSGSQSFSTIRCPCFLLICYPFFLFKRVQFLQVQLPTKNPDDGWQ